MSWSDVIRGIAYLNFFDNINEITFEQAEEAIVDINNWNIDNKNPIKDKFVPTNTETSNNNNTPSTISFKNSSSNGKQNWCGATF